MTLDALAESTKISRSLLADLERGDLSRWPAGIYGRAFIREYAKALRLPANEIVEEFRLSLDDGESVLTTAPNARRDGVEFRLMLADSPKRTPGPLRARLLDAACALVLVLLVGYAATLATGLAYWTASGVVALIWCPLMTILGGGSLRRVVMSARHHRDAFRRAARIFAIPRGRPHRRLPTGSPSIH